MLDLSAVEKKILEVCEMVETDYEEHSYESFVIVYGVKKAETDFTYFLSYMFDSEMSPKEATQYVMKAIKEMDSGLYREIGINYDDSNTDFFEV